MAERVRAKFRVQEIKRSTRSQGYAATPVEIRTVVMQPVYSSDPEHENKKFWEATPSGTIELGVINQDAWEHFELDREYYVDFTPADG